MRVGIFLFTLDWEFVLEILSVSGFTAQLKKGALEEVCSVGSPIKKIHIKEEKVAKKYSAKEEKTTKWSNFLVGNCEKICEILSKKRFKDAYS